jgi:prepilin-type N-terminal cleavage/methylation domain-containing protein
MGKARLGKISGFTLLELMLVVTVLAIVIAIAIPSFMSSKKYANETSAIATLKNVGTAQTQYRTRFGVFGTLTDLTGGGYLDDSLLDSQKAGYDFMMTGVLNSSKWAVGCQPVDQGSSGDRWFYVDQSGVIRQKNGSAPDSTDPPVE